MYLNINNLDIYQHLSTNQKNLLIFVGIQVNFEWCKKVLYEIASKPMHIVKNILKLHKHHEEVIETDNLFSPE